MAINGSNPRRLRCRCDSWCMPKKNKNSWFSVPISDKRKILKQDVDLEEVFEQKQKRSGKNKSMRWAKWQ